MDFDTAIKSFRSNLDLVSKLVDFDKEVQQFAIASVQSLHDRLVNSQNITNERLNGSRTLEILRSMRESPVLKDRYEIIYNQAVVLMVSHFGSALGDLFRVAASVSIKNSDAKLLATELKLNLADVLAVATAPEELIGDLIILKEDISFQDMQSTHRSFKKFFGVTIEIDDDVKNIIAAQACRHVIVHNGGKVNQRTINQLRNISPRSLKPNLNDGDLIKFVPGEIEMLAGNMIRYVEMAAGKFKHVASAI